MNACSFILWKFKTIEGILKYMRSSDLLVTKYENGNKSFKIIYDAERCMARIVSDNGRFADIDVSFSELPNKLRILGAYELKPKEECHSSALVAYGTKSSI